MPERYVLLSGGDPGHAALPCHTCTRPVFPGHYFVAADLGAPLAGFLCADCARRADPALAEAVDAVNTLRALATAIDPAHAEQLAAILTEVAGLLSGATPENSHT